MLVGSPGAVGKRFACLGGGVVGLLRSQPGSVLGAPCRYSGPGWKPRCKERPSGSSLHRLCSTSPAVSLQGCGRCPLFPGCPLLPEGWLLTGCMIMDL